MSSGPRENDSRGHLFGLVDVLYACHATGDAELRRRALLLEDAFGRLKDELETGALPELQRTQDNLEAFGRFVALG